MWPPPACGSRWLACHFDGHYAPRRRITPAAGEQTWEQSRKGWASNWLAVGCLCTGSSVGEILRGRRGGTASVSGELAVFVDEQAGHRLCSMCRLDVAFRGRDDGALHEDVPRARERSR